MPKVSMSHQRKIEAEPLKAPEPGSGVRSKLTVYNGWLVSVATLFNNHTQCWRVKIFIFGRRKREKHLTILDRPYEFDSVEAAHEHGLVLARFWCDEHAWI